MQKSIGAVLAAAFLTLSLAACATNPPPPPPGAYPEPPPKKPYDAKTQLESGRRY